MWLSNISLIISNLVVIYLAMSQNWSSSEIFLSFWCQGTIIGFFSFLRILAWRPYPNGEKRGLLYRILMAGFFVIHYGVFQASYLMFILAFVVSKEIFETKINVQNPKQLLINFLVPILIFFINHLISFVVNFKNDRYKNQNVGIIMLSPYFRTIPMNVAMMFGFSLGAQKFIFLTAKGVMDYLGHIYQHLKLGEIFTDKKKLVEILKQIDGTNNQKHP
jgi:hypothetical protein